LDPNLSYGESYCHDTPLHFAARHSMKSLLRYVSISENHLQGLPMSRDISSCC
jgi:hypothetical protein